MLQGEHQAGVFQEVEGGAVAPVGGHEMDAGAAVMQEPGQLVKGAACDVIQPLCPGEDAKL